MALHSFELPSPVDYHLVRGGIPLLMRLRYIVKGALPLKIKALVPGIWAKGCLFDGCVSVI